MRLSAFALALVLVADCGGSGSATTGVALDAAGSGDAGSVPADSAAMGGGAAALDGSMMLDSDRLDGGDGGLGGMVGAGGAAGAQGADAGQVGGMTDAGQVGGMAEDASPSAGNDSAAPADMAPMTGPLGPRDPGPGVVPLPGRPGDYICPHGATHEACCLSLCECVTRVCADTDPAGQQAKTCMSTCRGLSDALARCHVYQCYDSVSPNARIDHSALCAHATNAVGGGACPAGVL